MTFKLKTRSKRPYLTLSDFYSDQNNYKNIEIQLLEELIAFAKKYDGIKLRGNRIEILSKSITLGETINRNEKI